MQNAISRQDDAISESLVNARLKAESLPDFPGSLPKTLEQAYALQSASIGRWDDEVVAWIVAKLSASDRAQFESDRLIGPIFGTSIQKLTSDSLATVHVYKDGFAAIEAEYALELGETVKPSDRVYSDQALAELVSSVYAAAEVASSPMAAVNSIGAMAVIPDFGANCGLVVGPKIPNWCSLPAGALTAIVSIDGTKAGEATTKAIRGDPLQAVRALIDVCRHRDIELPKGTLVSTGALTGVHDVTVTSTACLDFGSFGSFEVRFEAVSPAA